MACGENRALECEFMNLLKAFLRFCYETITIEFAVLSFGFGFIEIVPTLKFKDCAALLGNVLPSGRPFSGDFTSVDF